MDTTGENSTENKSVKYGHLTSWKPGTSGNPNGRPKGSKDSIGAALRRLLRKRAFPDAYDALCKRYPDMDPKEFTNALAIAGALVDKSIRGDVQAAKLLFASQGELTKTTAHIHADGLPDGALSLESMTLAQLSTRLAQVEADMVSEPVPLTIDVKPNNGANGKNGKGKPK